MNFVSESARILAVFPTPSISHQVVFRPLTQELARRGHEVVVITTDPAYPKGEAPGNLTEVDVHDVSYTIWSKVMSMTSTGKRQDLHSQVEFSLRLFGEIFEKQIQSDEVRAIIRNKKQKFDLLIVEALIAPTLAFSHIFKAPVIQISSFTSVRGDYEAMGAPTHPILYPEMTNQKLYNLSIWERLSVVWRWLLIRDLYGDIEVLENEMLKRNFGPSMPELAELRNNVDMLFLNMHPIWEDNRPVPPGVVFMGSIHQNPVKELPKELKSYLDDSKSGVIYVNLGTNIESILPAEKVQTMLKVFSKMPQNILLKWNAVELNTSSTNIKISKWFPQSDLLRHPKVKLFITQGGLQATNEAISAGVPLIGIPMFGDQWFNVEKYVKHNIGLRVDVDSITEESFENAISTVLNNKSYRKSIIRLRSIMRDEPMSGLQRAVWWTEHVLRHGGARHLRAPAANISWGQYLELELLVILLALVLSVIIALLGAVYFAWVYWEYTDDKKVKTS
ncbi:UDP-glucoronosyl and UDP-glucosyl transferase domain-containing protein [Phthorimaea operculella]|nr:UDP-glucoronosyl and UDP-glucosyl transferase domain-containing protein [Phthorimaea operculella]